jgi:hypothetical protein
MACLQKDFPYKGFSTVFLECPETASTILECARCEIIMTDEGTLNEIDLANKSQCTSCTVCQNTAAFNCSNLVKGDCAIQDCHGICTASGSNDPTSTPPTQNKPEPEPTVSPTSTPTNMPTTSPPILTIIPTPETSPETTIAPTPETSSTDSLDCGVPDICTTAVLNTVADGFACGDRIVWLMDTKGESEEEACRLVANEQSKCKHCDPSVNNSPEPTIPPTPETSPDPAPTIPLTPEPTTEPTIPSTPEPSKETTVPPTPEPTNPSTSTSTPRPTSPNEPSEFSMQRFRAQGIKMTLDNVEPLCEASSLRWQDITGHYMAVEMKETIGSKLVEALEVSVSFTSQHPTFVSRRALLGKKMSILRRLQAVELTFDAVISIESDVNASAVSSYIEEIFNNKDVYLAALRESGDNSLENAENVSVTPAPSVVRVEDPADNVKPATALVVGSVAAGIAATGLVAFFLARRRTNRLSQVTPHGRGNDSSTVDSGIYIDDASKASSSKRSFPRWLSHRLFTIKESTSDSDEGNKGSTSKIPFPAPSDIDEESLFVNNLTDIPIHAHGESDEDSVGRSSFSSITSGYSYPSANWSLPSASFADDLTVSSYGTKDDDISR